MGTGTSVSSPEVELSTFRFVKASTSIAVVFSFLSCTFYFHRFSGALLTSQVHS
jgi:hypothetical protein